MIAAIVEQLRRGECSSRKRHEQACATCDAVDARIAHVLALEEALQAARAFRERFGDALTLGKITGPDSHGLVHFVAMPDPIKARLDAALAALDGAR